MTEKEMKALAGGIRSDMIAHAGKELPFEFTDTLVDPSGRVWHEFVVEDNPEELTLYACLRSDGSARVEQEIPE